MSLSNRKWKEALMCWLVQVMMPGFFSFFKSIKFVDYLLALIIPDVFWHRCSSLCSRIGQQHHVQQVDVTQVGLEDHGNLFACVQRPAHQVRPHSIGRRLAGARYQLDIAPPQAGIVGNGRHQEDPVVHSFCFELNLLMLNRSCSSNTQLFSSINSSRSVY